MDAIGSYSFVTCGWLSLQALPLIVWPSLVSSLLTEDYQHPGPVEQYFARCLGFSQFALGVVLVTLSGVLPLTAAPEESDGTSPFASAAVLISSLYHGTTAFYAYTRFHEAGQAGFIFQCVGSSLLAAFGLWCVMFAGSGRVSKRTGADKRTSGFPFKNAEANKKSKKGQ